METITLFQRDFYKFLCSFASKFFRASRGFKFQVSKFQVAVDELIG